MTNESNDSANDTGGMLLKKKKKRKKRKRARPKTRRKDEGEGNKEGKNMQRREGIGEKKNSGGRNFAICHSKEQCILANLSAGSIPPSFPPDESYAPERIATCSALFSFVVEASGAVNNRWSTRL